MRGFTLIELMIALSLIALMVSLLFGGIRLGNRTWERVDATTTRSSEMRQIWQFLESRFRQARVEYEITEEASGSAKLVARVQGKSGLVANRINLTDPLASTRWTKSEASLTAAQLDSLDTALEQS